jgi:formylglycine-generating enzyme required for sulfatase activity
MPTLTSGPPRQRRRPGAFIEPFMVRIPAGSFVMGATENDKFANLLERPRRLVTIARPFALAATPVTFAQWDAYAEATGAHRPGDGGFGRAVLPVMGVSWRDAVGYCDWLAATTGKPYRLPSEAEWEYACRAGTTTVFHTGNSITIQEANFMYDEVGAKIGHGRPMPVGSYAPNAFGLYDMHGNVAELVQDHWHDGYPGAPSDGSAWIDGDGAGNRLRVVRGGSWDYMPRLIRSAYRDLVGETRRVDNVGFRLALDLPENSAERNRRSH